jgi:signal peptidase I
VPFSTIGERRFSNQQLSRISGDVRRRDRNPIHEPALPSADTFGEVFVQVDDRVTTRRAEVLSVIKELPNLSDSEGVTRSDQTDLTSLVAPEPKPHSFSSRSGIASYQERPDPVMVTPREPEVPESSRQRSAGRNLLEWVVVVLAAAAVALLVRTTMLQVFFIPSGSMENTLRIDDKVLVDKLSHRLSGIHRGDVVVFRAPANIADAQTKDFVKRVIAIEGDTIEAIDGRVFVNDVPVNEPYIEKQGTTLNLPRTTLGSGQLWVMGDNREFSADSRRFGPITTSMVVGHARVVVMHGRTPTFDWL